MNKDKALKMAIEAMESCTEYSGNEYWFDGDVVRNALKTAREALAEAEKQEPVAVITPDNYGEPRLDFIGTFKYKATTALNPDIPLYTHPATWQGLEFMELSKIWFEFVMPKDENGKHKERFGYAGVFIQEIEEFARAIEQALKEKND